MNMLWFILIVLILVGVGFFVVARRRAVAAPQNAKLRAGTASDAPAPDEPPLQALEKSAAGDAVVFWDGADGLIDSVLGCSETFNSRTTAWRWLLLDNGGVIELAPDGSSYYNENTVFHQGSLEFDLLTSDIDEDGVLKTFEERVRLGRAVREPVFFEYHENTYQVRSTGVFAARPQGTPTRREVWRDVSDDPGQNVYFQLTTADGGRALGIWTTHILFVVGRTLTDADIRGVYRR